MGSGVSEAEGGGVTLPLDKTRCLDTDCPQARTCARWVHRNDHAQRQLSYVASLRQGETCEGLIQERREDV